MKFFNSNSKTLILLQILSLLIIISSVFTINYSLNYLLLSVLFFYIYSIVGISMMLHKYYSHKSFKLNNFFKFILTIPAILSGRGSPLGWVYIHRIHHATADTNKDPHSPYNKFKFIGFTIDKEYDKKINFFIVKDLLTPVQIKIDKYYLLIILFFLILLFFINYNLIFYIWALPVFLVSFSQTMFNYFAHKYGYRNFETKDCSTNNFYLWPFILGDAWHNNHHSNPLRMSNKVKYYEFDPVCLIINLIKQK